MAAKEEAGERTLMTPLAQFRALRDVVQAIAYSSDERSRTQRDALTAFLVRVASAAILYLSQVVLARWMGRYEYGIYVFVWTSVLMLGGLSHLGLNMGMIRLLPRYEEAGQQDRIRGLLLGGRLIALGCSTVVAAAGFALIVALEGRIDSDYWLPAVLAMACVPMATLSDVQDGIGRGRALMAIGLLPPYVLRPLLLLLAMFAAHAFGLAMTASTAAGAAILSTWLAALVQTLLLWRHFSRTLPAGPRCYEPRTWLATSLPLLAIGVSELVLQNADVLLISRYLGPADVAVYFAAAKTMSLVLFVHYAVGSAVANRYAAMHARGDSEGLKRFVRDAVNWTFWPSLAAAAGLVVLGRPLLGLFGPQFTDGYGVMVILVLGFLMRASMGPSEFLLNMLGEQRLCAISLASAAAINVALLLVLVPAYGIHGAATATALSLAIAAFFNWLVARRKLGLEISIWSGLLRSRR